MQMIFRESYLWNTNLNQRSAFLIQTQRSSEQTDTQSICWKYLGQIDNNDGYFFEETSTRMYGIKMCKHVQTVLTKQIMWYSRVFYVLRPNPHPTAFVFLCKLFI